MALAATICETPIAMVTLVDSERQWFKARIGVDLVESPRAISYCDYAIAGEGDMMEVPDIRLDERFAENPFVTGEPRIRMYVGAVLRDRHGRALGSLCVLDRRARSLSAVQLQTLSTLATQVTSLVKVRGSVPMTHRVPRNVSDGRDEWSAGVAAESFGFSDPPFDSVHSGQVLGAVQHDTYPDEDAITEDQAAGDRPGSVTVPGVIHQDQKIPVDIVRAWLRRWW